MSFSAVISALIVLSPLSAEPADTSANQDYEISRVVRKAVRQAPQELLKTTVLADWREYLKVVGRELTPETQPLLLIKFDEDSGFRSQLKTIIEWQRDWQRRETEHYIFYFHPDLPIPELLVDILDGHFNEVAKLFDIADVGKIPYRYDVAATAGKVYPYEDLRAGIVSTNPFDFQRAALAIFYSINAEPPLLLKPLAHIYGAYFQNQATAQAYYDRCRTEIERERYVSATQLYQVTDFDGLTGMAWCSAYAFVFDLLKEFGAVKVKAFLGAINCRMAQQAFEQAFSRHFGVTVEAFEKRYTTLTATKQ